MRNWIKKGWLLSFLLLLVWFGFQFYQYLQYQNQFKKNYQKLNLDKVENVMFVAHPDDDTIWGGDHLLKENYLVVCITCGDKKHRVKEFKKVMKQTKNPYIMLNYVDKDRKMKKPDYWLKYIDSIEEDIERILKLKNWKKIVTHNLDGEYGHIQHRLTSKLVSQTVMRVNHNIDQLYYFGVYYRPSQVKKLKDQLIPTMSKQDLEQKKNVLFLYRSQDFIHKRFGHMFPYENWVKATDWQKKAKEIQTILLESRK